MIPSESQGIQRPLHGGYDRPYDGGRLKRPRRLCWPAVQQAQGRGFVRHDFLQGLPLDTWHGSGDQGGILLKRDKASAEIVGMGIRDSIAVLTAAMPSSLRGPMQRSAMSLFPVVGDD